MVFDLLYKHSLNEEVNVKAYLLSSVRNRIARLYERDHILEIQHLLIQPNFYLTSIEHH
jgi:hypothetical protein